MMLAATTATAAELVGGFVQRLGDLDDALSWAGELSGLAPLTVAAHTVALERSAPPAAVDELVAEARARVWARDDAAEGRAAVLEKRTPRFTGR